MIRLTEAELVCFRTYDVADEISLEMSRELITRQGTEPQRMSLNREGSEYIQLQNPPLNVDLGRRELKVGTGTREVVLSARIFHYGAISVTARLKIEPGSTFESLIPLADELYDSREVDALTLEELKKLRAMVEPALKAPHLWDQNEGYTVLFARKIEGDPPGSAILEEPNLARLLLGEVREPRLSEGETREVLGYHYSYTPNDLAVIEWNAAFLYEPTGSDDIIDLVEIANAQLLELRYYDNVLDGELDRIYDVIGDRRKGSTILFSPYKRLLHELMQTLIELSEFIERIENALKIVGDVYLARVYEAAMVQFRIKQWTEQVSRKHRLLQQTYGLLKGETDTGRALTLEMMVVVLILLEIIMALAQVTH